MGAPCLFLAVVAAGLAAGIEPQAQPSVHVAIQGNLPFTAAEIEKSLSARLPPDAPAGTLTLSVRPDGLLEMSWQSRTRVVDISRDEGSAATRVVALLAADLFLPLQPLPLPPPAALSPPAEPPARESATHLAVGYAVSAGNGQNPLLRGPALSVGRDGRRFRIRASAGWMTSSTQNLLALTAWPLRVGAGAGTSYFSLILSCVMIPYQLQGLVDATRTLVGAASDVEARLNLGRGFSLRALAGGDFFFSRRTRVVAGNLTLFQSPVAALHLALHLAWELPR